jgi:kojibiose phosphorylase
MQFQMVIVKKTKPAPTCLHAVDQLGYQRRCVVVEDAAAGIEAAKAGGFRSIGLGPIERVSAADLVYPSLAGAHLDQILAVLG